MAISGLLVSTAGAQPVNDTCAGAIAIASATPACSPVEADVTLATTAGDPGVPSCQASISRSVWYTFTPASTGYFHITSCADQGTAATLDDVVLAIYTSPAGCAGPFSELAPGNLRDGCDDDSCTSEAFQSVIDTTLDAGVTYYIVAWKFGTTAPIAGNTALQLCVSEITPPAAPANDSCGGAIPLLLNQPVTASNGLGTENDYQLAAASACFPAGHTTTTAAGRDLVYSFTAASAGSYAFRVLNYVPISSSNLTLYLADSCPAATPGTPVTVACTRAANANAASGEEIGCVSLLAGQQVFLFVDEAVLGSGANFLVLVESCGATEAEPNDTPATASTMACGIIGSVSPPADTDFYALGTPAAGQRIFVATEASTSSSTDVDLRVNTATGTLEYDDANNSAFMGALAANVAGTIADGSPLFLQVKHFNATTGTASIYRLYAVVQPAIGSASPETEPNDATATANSAANTYFTGSLAGASPSTDVDTYRLQVSAGQQLFISLDGDPLRDNTPLNARLDVLDSGGTVLITINDGGASSSTTSGAGSLTAITPFSPGETVVYRVPSSGTYYVRVTAGSTSVTTAAGDYLLSIARNCTIGCSSELGDLEPNGIVDSSDLVILANFLVGNVAQGTPPFGAPLSAAELNLSDSVDVSDLVLLANYLVGNISCLPG